MDGYLNDTGFPLTAADQLALQPHDRAARPRPRSVGGAEERPGPDPRSWSRDFDFAVNEECAQYGECAALDPFVAAGKAVFHVEYALPTEPLLRRVPPLGLSSMRKKPELGVWRQPC